MVNSRYAARSRHYSRRTEQAHWARRYILFHGERHPNNLGEADIKTPPADCDAWVASCNTMCVDRSPLLHVHWAAHCHAWGVEHMGVDHCGGYILVPQ